MRLTPHLKQWLAANCDVDVDADDDEFRKAAGEALANGDLTAEKFADLCKAPQEVGELQKQLAGIGDALGRLTELMAGNAKATEPPAEKETPAKEKATTTPAEKAQPSQLAKMFARYGGTPTEPGDDEKGLEVRVKEAAEQYSTTKSALTYPTLTKAGHPHPMAGKPVVDFSQPGKGRTLDDGSQLDKAVAGAFAKYLCATAQRGGSRTFGFQSLPEHDRELLYYAMDRMDWAGASDGGDYADIKGRLTPGQQKALIDDATSGGLEAAPIVFDDQVIQTPLLHGELYPLVNTMPLDRGRRVEGVSTGTVTGSWGGVDDTSISLFNTASYVSAFDTTIYRWEGAIQIGLDFLSDTPIDFGAHVTAQYGERLLEDLDDVIAVGNGTTQPEGVMNKSGTTTVAWGGATSLGNYESLRFSVAKAEHRANVRASAVFCGTETSYQRACALPVGASDNRRLKNPNGVNNYDDYMWMERPFKINESLSNAQIFYAILARYRMYRRRGLTMRTSTEGDTLIRKNEMLMVAMARYGGQLERGAVAAVTTTAPA